MRKDSELAWMRFCERVTELGGTVIEPTWLGKDAPHRIRCAEGHESTPRPGDVRNGKGICRACAGQDPATAERRFRELVAAQGGTVLETPWLGNNSPHLVRCALGHEVRPMPSNIYSGSGICRVCASRDPAAAELRFRARVAELGGTLAPGQTWQGNATSLQVTCGEGHECAPRPSDVLQGGGLCRACAGNDPRTAERCFRERVEELGGRIVEPTWLGNKSPHRVVCTAGHECRPRPNDVQQGEGICRACAGTAWDVFYVVTDPGRSRLKLGITSGDPRPRLADHAANGFTAVSLLLKELPGDTAPRLEATALATLRLAGKTPVRGREYFDLGALGLVMEIARWVSISCASGGA